MSSHHSLSIGSLEGAAATGSEDWDAVLDSLDSTFSFGNEMSWENPNALQSSNDGSSIRLAQADSGRSLLRELSGFDTGAGSAPEAVAPSGGDEWLTQFAHNLAATGEDYLSIRNKVGMKMGRPPSTAERDIIKGAIRDFMDQDTAERVKRTRSGRQLPVGGGGQVQVQPRRENSERFVVTQKSAMHEASVARGQGGGIRQPHKRVRSGNLSSSFRNLSIDEEDEAGMLAAAAPGSFRDLLGSLNTDLDSLGRAPPAAPQQAQPPRPKAPEDAGFDVVCVRVPKGVTGGNMVQFATKTGSRVAARVPAGLVTGDIFRVRIPKNPSSGGNGGAGPAAAGVMMSGGLSLPNGGQASGWSNPAAARNPAQQVSAAASRAPSKKPAQRRKARFWTPEEDAALRAAVVEFKERQWKKIAARVPGRTHQQCLQRWRKVLRPDASNNVRKGKWTEEEDRTLYKLVLESVGGKREKLSGKHDWNQIASKFPQRTAKQCGVRWEHHLDPSINKGAWTEEEDRILMHQYSLLGKKWSKIAAFLPGRSDNAVKIRYIAHQRRMSAARNKAGQAGGGK